MINRRYAHGWVGDNEASTSSGRGEPALTRAPHGDQKPAVQRLRIRFAKRGRLRFTSHRDFQRAFERALRRADVPIAYSQGFSPHPRVSYVGAAPTGAASEAEYLEIAVTSRCDPAVMAHELDAALPLGLDILDVVEARAGSLADRVTASEWEIRLPTTAPGAVSTAVRAFVGRGGTADEGRGQDPRCPTSGRATRRGRGIFRPAVCDTQGGCTARNTDRSTRRRPRRPPASG
jgi:Uncharacterized protein conserved in bacteria (DUF2344)